MIKRRPDQRRQPRIVHRLARLFPWFVIAAGRDRDDAIWNPTLSRIRLRVRAAAGLIALLFTAVVRSETVDAKYRGNVNFKTFQRRHTLRSNFAQHLDWSQLLTVKGSENLTALIVR